MGEEDLIQTKTGRRNFIKAAVAAGATIALGREIKLINKFDLEKQVSNSQILRLDFYDLNQEDVGESFTEGFDRSRLLEEMGVGNSISLDSLSHATPTNDEQAKLFFLEALMFQYAGHGQDVDSVSQRTRKSLGLKHNPDTVSVSVASALIMQDNSVIWDSFGNPSIKIGFDTGRVKDLIRTNNQGVVSMSLEIGMFDMEYQMYKTTSRDTPLTSKISVGEKTTYFKDQDGEKVPISKEEYESIHTISSIKRLDEVPKGERTIYYTDGYWGEQTYSNLSNMARIAREFPDRIFVVAGGNPFIHETEGVQIPDIRDAKHKLAEEGVWPDNLIVVGFIGNDSGFSHPGSFGADVYVAYDDMNYEGRQGSSFAVPVVAEVASGIIDRGTRSTTEIASRLSEFTNKETYGDQIFDVLDLNKARNVLKQGF